MNNTQIIITCISVFGICCVLALSIIDYKDKKASMYRNVARGGSDYFDFEYWYYITVIGLITLVAILFLSLLEPSACNHKTTTQIQIEYLEEELKDLKENPFK